MESKIQKDVITKYVIQAIAVCFGFLGLVWICIGVHFAVTRVRDRDMFGMLYMTSMLLLGAVVVAIAYQNLRHFGPKSIRNVTGLAAFTLYTIVMTRVRPYQEAAWELKMELLDAATFFIPMLMAYFLYSVVSRKLIEITETKNIQQGAEPDAENGAG